MSQEKFVTLMLAEIVDI